MITKYEYLTLKERYKKGYRWIARDKDGCLYMYYREPKRLVFSWKDAELSSFEWSVNDDSFPCVKWEDAKPTKILDLIQDYEKHEELKGKVVIPQFVADWIEEIKDKNCAHALEILFDTASMPTEVYDWLKQDSKNWDIMARAWLDVYEVEKEKLYTVRLANGNCLYRFLSLGIDWMKGYSDYKNDPSCRLTQSEIESVDPVLMQIAEEVNSDECIS